MVSQHLRSQPPSQPTTTSTWPFLRNIGLWRFLPYASCVVLLIVPVVKNLSYGNNHTSSWLKGGFHGSGNGTPTQRFTQALSSSHNLIVQRREAMPLPELVRSKQRVECTNGGVPVYDTLGDPQLTFHNRKIPRIVHLTGKTRCLHPVLADNAGKWRLDDHSLFFHDDEAMDKLLYRDWPEFPQLKYVLKCVLYGGAVKADIWRVLVLWEYGGIYADFDSRPNRFNATTIQADDDAFFVMDTIGFPSQWFMAASPRHPLLYCIIHTIIQNIMGLSDVGSMPIVWTTGPGAVNDGFSKFLGPHVHRSDPNEPGIYTGAYGRTARVVGNHTHQDEYIKRNIYETEDGDNSRMNENKHDVYQTMGMEHIVMMGSRDEKNLRNETCFWLMWKEEMKDAVLWTPGWEPRQPVTETS